MHAFKRRNRKPQSKPQSHYNTFFDPMVYALDRIKAHFDERAHFTHDQNTGERVIKYALEDGRRMTIGSGGTARLVYSRRFVFFTEDQAKTMAQELGMI